MNVKLTKLVGQKLTIVTLAFIMSVVVPLIGIAPKVLASPYVPTFNYTRSFENPVLGGDSVVIPGYSSVGAITSDTNTNTLLAGEFRGTVDFDSSYNSSPITSFINNSNVFTTKYSNNGQFLWAKAFDIGYTGSADVYGIASDSNDNVYVSGTWRNTVDFDAEGSNPSANQDSANRSVFLVKYDSNGNFGWVRTFDTNTTPGYNDARSPNVAVDSQGNPYIVGQINGRPIFDGLGGSDVGPVLTGGSAIFITKFDSDGMYQSTKVVDAANNDSDIRPKDIAIDASNNMYIVGGWSGEVDFDGIGGEAARIAEVDTGNNFLLKYNADGTFSFVRIASSSNYFESSLASVAVSVGGDVFVAGVWNGEADLDGTSGTDVRTTLDPYRRNSFVTKYNANGTYGWTRVFGDTTTSDTYITDVALDSDGAVFVGGNVRVGTVVFDGVGGTDSRTYTNSNVFAVKYTGSGTYVGTVTPHLVDGDSRVGYAGDGRIAVNNADQLLLESDFRGSVTFDGSSGSDTRTATNHSAFFTSYVFPILGGGGGGSGTPDGDSSSPTVENASPNAGDANNDGIQDSTQGSVTNFVSPVSSDYVVLQSNCAVNTSANVVPEDTNHPDNSYQYPMGLMDFTLLCGTGATATITHYYYGNYDATTLVMRKYDTRTNTYTNIPGAVLTNVTIGGRTALKAVYQVTDGDSLDQDGLVNGVIIDPAGPAILGSSTTTSSGSPNSGGTNSGGLISNTGTNNGAGAPNTGFAKQSSLPVIATGLTGFSILGYGLFRRKKLASKKAS